MSHAHDKHHDKHITNYITNEQIMLLDKLAFESIHQNENIFYDINDDEMKEEYESNHKIQESIKLRHEERILKIVNFILSDKKYHSLIEAALDLLDDCRIRCIQTSSQSKRCFWIVPSASYSGGSYNCLKYYCPCRNFYDLAKFTSSKVFCKHLLAIRIGMALGGIIKTNVVNDVAFVNQLLEDNPNSQISNQQQHHHLHQQQQHHLHQQQQNQQHYQQQNQQHHHQSPSRFAPSFNLMRDNEFDG